MPGDHVSNFIKHFWVSRQEAQWASEMSKSIALNNSFISLVSKLASSLPVSNLRETFSSGKSCKFSNPCNKNATKEPGSLPMWWLSHLFVPSASVVAKCNHHNNPLAQKPLQVPQVAACRDQTACYEWIAWHWRQDAWRLRGHTEPGNCLCPLSLSSPRSLRKPGVGLAHECPLITAP